MILLLLLGMAFSSNDQADFLNDLPSYNKENFKNFQPNFNRSQVNTPHRMTHLLYIFVYLFSKQPKTQSTFHCTNECTDSQVVVNQKYNIVVKYLEKSVFNDEKQCQLNANKKRESPSCSNEPNDSEPNSSDNEAKSFKKLRTSASDELMLIEPSTSASLSTHTAVAADAGAATTHSSINQIDVDEQTQWTKKCCLICNRVT